MDLQTFLALSRLSSALPGAAPAPLERQLSFELLHHHLVGPWPEANQQARFAYLSQERLTLGWNLRLADKRFKHLLLGCLNPARIYMHHGGLSMVENF